MKGYIFKEKAIAVDLGTVIGYLDELYMKKTDLLDMCIH